MALLSWTLLLMSPASAAFSVTATCIFVQKRRMGKVFVNIRYAFRFAVALGAKCCFTVQLVFWGRVRPNTHVHIRQFDRPPASSRTSAALCLSIMRHHVVEPSVVDFKKVNKNNREHLLKDQPCAFPQEGNELQIHFVCGAYFT